MNKCIDCKKEINKLSLRCKRCANLGSNNPNFNTEAKSSKIHRCNKCSKLIVWQTAEYGSGKCRSCSNREIKHIAWNKGIKNSTSKYWLGKSNKNIIIKHHVDLRQNSNRTIEMAQGQHRSLHWRAYNYLVLIDLVEDYLIDFKTKYNINYDNASYKVVHHKDGNRDNNKDTNLLYLESKAIHNKLHQEAYEYLVKNSMIDNYIAWFFSQEEKNQMVKV